MPVISEGMWPLCLQSWGVQNQLYRKLVSVLLFNLVSYQLCSPLSHPPQCYFTKANLSNFALSSLVVPNPPNNLAWHPEPITAHLSLFPLRTLKTSCSSFSKGLPSSVSCLCAFTWATLSSWHGFIHTCLANSYPSLKLSRSHSFRKPSVSPVAA